MTSDCRNFRARLADALRGESSLGLAPGLASANGSGWHVHVINCAACRELLEEEEALDELLLSLPKPHLPPELAERVLSRLDGARRGLDLDRLLELQTTEPAPANLARGVLARVHAEQGLDRLLERWPAQPAPAGFERRILARLALARRGQPVGSQATPRQAAPVKRSAGLQMPVRIAAAVLLVGLAGWGAWSLRRSLSQGPGTPEPLIGPLIGGRDSSDEQTPQPLPIPAPQAQNMKPEVALSEPDDQLLASLDVLEAWDLLASADGVDASLATLDSLDEYLLDFRTPTTTTDSEAAPEESSEVPASEPKNTKKNG